MRLATAAAAALTLALGAAPAAQARPAPSTPEKIENAVDRGDIGRARGHLLLAYAVAAPDRLPPAYRSSVPWDGTLPLLELHRALRTMPPGPTAREIEALVEPAAAGSCSSSSSSLPNSTSTAHFHVEYGSIAAASDLDIADYTASLETSWTTEVDAFGWAAPPVAPTPAPGSKYHVRIDALSPGLYGFVSHVGTYAGLVGNNPNTAWSDGDAYASCMVLNNDYSGFDPSSPQAALDSTTGHEFNHSLQYGYGGLSGANLPDDVFVEGGATWAEDEVHDSANDNYLYLWPVFSDGMGDYDASPYPYWITFRGLTERFGTGVAGGGEDVMQRFWELTSKNEASNLGAMNSALVPEGTTLADAFHDYAIAVKFKKPCGGAHVLPYCFQEAAAYPSNTAAAANAGTIAAVGGSVNGTRVEDHYAIRWIGLPTAGGPYSVTLTNTSSAGGPGRLRGTVVCDSGSALARHPLPALVADGGSGTVGPVDPAGCSSVVLVVTNQTKTADNPGTSPTRRFNVTTAAAVSSHALTVTKAGDGSGTVTSSPAGINCGSTCAADFVHGTSVTLTATAASDSTFTGWTGACTGTGSCVVSMTQARSVTATFQADRSLSVTKSGDGSGTVTSSPAGIDCGVTCSADFAHGTSVTLTPVAANGSTFTGWSGACTGSGSCVVSMTQARAVTATFQADRSLSVTKAGDGSGTVTSSPAGINCGSTCAADFVHGTSVTLTATAAVGSSFTGWSGACSGTGSCVVSMTQARTVTATFEAQTPQLSVSKDGDGAGTVVSEPEGIDCGVTCSAEFAFGTPVTLTAEAAAGSSFTGWSGACSGTGSCQVSMTQARNVTATFQADRSLSVTKAGDGSGTITSTPAGVDCGTTCSAQFPHGTSVTLTAAAASDSTFAGWTGACTGTGSCVVSMTQARSVTATFQAKRSLTVTKAGDGSGTVTSDPAGIDCGSTCSGLFAHGTSVTLTPAAANGSTFTGWSGACTGSGSCVVSMTQARAVTATFQADRSLSVTKSGDGSGTVTSSPAGINCGVTCSADFAHGTSVTLTAAAAVGSTFTGWSGACTGTGGCVVSMTQARSVTATFDAQTPELSVSKGGDGAGTVASDPEGIDCGATCSAEFTYATQVTLSAVAESGSTFTGWSGACSGTGSCVVSMTQARSVTATFQADRSLSVAKDGDGSGTVTSSPSGIDCGSTCSAQFAHGTSVTLTPAAPEGSTFTGWSGACTGGGSCVVSMTQARNVTATFEAHTPLLSVSKAGDGTGLVSSDEAGIDCGVECSAEFAYDTVVTLTAAAAPGSTFTGWTGACTGTATCQVTMTEARDVTATFQANRALAVTKSGDGAGTVSSAPPAIDCGSTCSAPFAHGTVVTLTATAAEGSTFTGWSGACSGTGSCVVSMTEARNATATFTLPATPFTPPPTQPDPPISEPDPPASEPDPEREPAPSPLTPTIDTVPPQISFLSPKRIRATRTGWVRLRLGCPESETPGCEGRVRLFLLRPKPATSPRVAQRSFDIAAGTNERLRMRLARVARRQLARTGRIRVRAVVRVTDAAGNVGELRRTLTIRPPA